MEQVDAKTAVKKLKQQNEKLKSELSTIKKSLNQAISTQKNAEIQQKRPNFSGDNEDETIKALHIKLQKLKKERDSLKALATGSNDDATANLENEIKYLRSQLKDAEKEQKLLMKVLKEQEKGLEQMNLGQLSPEKKSQLEDEVKRAREEYKRIQAKIKAEEQQWKLDHQKMVLLKEKIREKNPRAVVDEEEKKSPQDEEINELNKKIEALNKMMQTEDSKLKRTLLEISNNQNSIKTEYENLQKKVSKLDEELQLKSLKIKELKQSVASLQKKVNEAARDHKKDEIEN